VAEALKFGALAAIALIVWVGGLIWLDVLTPDDVRAWRRLSQMRGYAGRRSRVERAAERLPFMRRLLAELDIDRLLAIAGRSDTPLTFITRSAALALAFFAVALAGDAATRETTGRWPVPLWIAVLFGVTLFLLRIARLRNEARRAQDGATRTLADMMMMVAAITDARGFQVHDVICLLARCSRDPSLAQLVDRDGWRRLVHEPHRSTGELYRQIAAQFRTPLFARLADVIATTDVGFPERDAYTRLAIAVQRDRLADARVRSARAKVLVTLPVAGMLIPLLLLVGAPTFDAILRGFNGG
jgi:hypothetical protein